MDIKETKAFLKANAEQDYAWLAAKTGKSVDAVRKLYRSLGLPPKKLTTQNTTVHTPEKQFELDMAKLTMVHASKQTDKKYDIAMKEVVRLRDELQTIISLEDQVSTYVIKASKEKGGEATAVAVLSDWHVEENVTFESVNGSNEYTMKIAKKRAEKCFQSILKLVNKEGQDVRINTLVLALLGDFFSGNIHDELMETCEVQPQDAMLFAQNLIASGIEFLLANSKLKIVVPCAVGNHSRMTHKVHVATEQGLSLEWAMYNFLATYFRDEKRVTFVLSRAYFNYVDIYGYKIRFHHGHAVNYGGGVGGLEVPMRKIIGRWDKDTQAYLSVCGHFHTRRDGGDFIVNGSLIGDSPYGKRFGFTGQPEQAFFLIDKDHGKTGVFPIIVK